MNSEGSFKVDVKVLRAVLGDVESVIEARSTIPVMSNVLLMVERGKLTVVGSDMEMELERVATVESTDRFQTTAQAAVLKRIVGKLPADAEALVQVGGGKLKITVGRSKFETGTLPAEDFPRMSAGEAASVFEMPALTLNGAFGRVAHAISSEETRYYLNGVYCHVGDGAIRFAATDGHRMARVVLPMPDGAEDLPGTILGRKAMKALSGLLDRHEGNIELSIGARFWRAEVGATTMIAKVIDGTFPDYTRVIPVGNQLKLSIDREQLAAAVGRVITITKDKTRAVKLELDSDRLVLTVTCAETGIATEEMACDYPRSQQALTIGFNARYLLDALGQLNADAIELQLHDPAAPTLLRDDEQSVTTLVLMPLRV